MSQMNKQYQPLTQQQREERSARVDQIADLLITINSRAFDRSLLHHTNPDDYKKNLKAIAPKFKQYVCDSYYITSELSSDFEKRFILSMLDQFNKPGAPTQRQLETIARIVSKITCY